MTEPELEGVLMTRFKVDRAALTNLGHPDFPLRLFDGPLDRTQASSLLIDMFNRYICDGHELCQAEKNIISHVKKWENKGETLKLVCLRFWESDLTEGREKWPT